jgi:LmbE family N-acetylglucosaminyl deacetylase/GT2 family glycosyltransferase
MQDRQTELIFHPRDLLSLDGVDRVLCVAPHPDDEVFGCGGLLAAWVDRGCAVHTLILTCGQQGQSAQAAGEGADLAAQRRQESVRAAAELGTPAPSFLDLPDRALRYDSALVAALSQAIAQHSPQVLLLPSLSEPHPDHQAAALAGLAAARDAAPGLHTVLFYESGAPLHANLHFPIDAVAERKWRAVQCFTSQLGVEDYEVHARAMAKLRAFGLRPPCQQAESFFRVDLAAVREKGALAALPQWPWVRERLALANDPAQLPLVSVLVRSMDRACLPEALASVALQTHANLELVVVNASGGPHRPLDFLPPTLPWRVVSPPKTLPPVRPEPVEGPAPTAQTTDGPCGRAQAANLALAAAQGEYALFLDDDDLLEPQHLERLIAALQAHPQAVGAYAGVRVETQDGAHLRDYDLPWSRQRLQGVNFLPIHAVLFRMDSVRQRGLRFDEQLLVLEDWDFWLQLTEAADLVHCPGVSAVYRQGLGQSALGDAQHPHHWRLWHRRLLQQRVQALAPEALADTLAWHAVELDRTQADAARQTTEHHSAVALLQQAQAALLEAQAFTRQSETSRQALQQQLEAFGRESQAALAAKESALQLQAAESARVLAERELQAQSFAAQAQGELDGLQTRFHAMASEKALMLQAKEAELQRLGFEIRQALDTKEAELQRVAVEAGRALQARDTEHALARERLSQHIEQLQAELSRRDAELRAVYASRSWRWTAALRRGSGPVGGAGA